MPQLPESIKKLNEFNNEPGIAQLAETLRELFEHEGTDATQNIVENLRKQLNTLSVDDTPLAEAAYHCLLTLAERFPIINTNLNLEEISFDSLFISSTGYLFDINDMATFYNRNNNDRFINFYTREPFNSRDEERIRKLCVDKNIPLNLSESVRREALLLPLIATLEEHRRRALRPTSIEVRRDSNHEIAIHFYGTNVTINRLSISRISNGEYEVSICAHLSAALRLAECLVRFDINRDSINRVIAFPEGNNPDSEPEFLLRGTANNIQIAVVRVLDMIKHIEGEQIFGEHEAEILNLIPSMSSGSTPRI